MQGSQTVFERPKTSCIEYNDYPYGFLDRNPYMKQTTESEIISRFARRNITVLIGGADTETEYLDMTCSANLEGKNRYERGVIFYNYLKQFLPGSNSALVVVPNVGHNDELMYNSEPGRKVLFTKYNG